MEPRRSHVDPHLAIGQGVQDHEAMTHLSPDHLFVGQAALLNKANKTTCAVAAVLNLSPIGVVDDVFKVGVGPAWGAHAEDLIRTNPKMTVCKPAVLGWVQVQWRAGFVQHDEVVASPLHFGEVNPHGLHYRRLC